MGIQKHIFQVVVFTEDVVNYDPALVDIAYDIEDGDWIGEFRKLSVEDVPPEKLKDELIAIGNDGTFFELEGDDEEA